MKRSLLLLALLTACRDVPDRFTAPNPFDSLSAAEAGRLTWNAFEDHSPAWNASSDSVYYSARSYPGLPTSRGLLLTVPRTKGRAALLLKSLQGGLPVPVLTAPAFSPDRQSIAFVQVALNTEPVCTSRIQCPLPPLSGIDTSYSLVPLLPGTLRVRPLNGGPEVKVEIKFEGVRDSFRIAHPFQRQYDRDRADVFRPSWSPDGTRIVFSDGLRLLILNVASGVVDTIPGTADGVWPAWSPTGDVIAFTRLMRLGSTTVRCDCYANDRIDPVMRLQRTIYNDGRDRVGTLVLINPDGSNPRELGIGEAPAWSPDGNTLVFQRGGQLYRSAANGANATPIPNTDFAYEPAISPDGRFLAFTRDPSQRDRVSNTIIPNDIWVVDF
jgi:Tol biopolymer transport system component